MVRTVGIAFRGWVCTVELSLYVMFDHVVGCTVGVNLVLETVEGRQLSA